MKTLRQQDLGDETDGRRSVSYPEMRYPSLRDDPLKSAFTWLRGKAVDDGAEGLWRIHDGLYDFASFVQKHPGGSDWLALTKGTDITEAFESHHVSEAPERALAAYRVRDAASPRNSPFTFAEDGLYRALKRRVRRELVDAKRASSSSSAASKRVVDALALGALAGAAAACRATPFGADALWWWTACAASALLLAWTTTGAHNFVHQRDNWRMHLVGLTFMTTREFRILHVLSHHQYPNTLLDAEMTLLEPFMQWLPKKSKSSIARFGPRLYSFLLSPFVFDASVLSRIVVHFRFKDYPAYRWEDLIPFAFPAAMYLSTGCSANPTDTLITWLFIVHMSVFVVMLISVHAVHHHPDIFHEGDEPASRDWGAHQLRAVGERREVNSAPLFAVLTNYGEHALHHLFPALDHAVLATLHDAVQDECARHGERPPMETSVRDMFVGSFRQMARVQ